MTLSPPVGFYPPAMNKPTMASAVSAGTSTCDNQNVTVLQRYASVVACCSANPRILVLIILFCSCVCAGARLPPPFAHFFCRRYCGVYGMNDGWRGVRCACFTLSQLLPSNRHRLPGGMATTGIAVCVWHEYSPVPHHHTYATAHLPHRHYLTCILPFNTMPPSFMHFCMHTHHTCLATCLLPCPTTIPKTPAHHTHACCLLHAWHPCLSPTLCLHLPHLGRKTFIFTHACHFLPCMWTWI